MPGFGKRIGPAIRTPEGEVLELKSKLARHEKLYAEHVGELVERLFGHYIVAPDKETEKLLIMHLGGEFFRKRDAAQQSVQADGEILCKHGKGHCQCDYTRCPNYCD